MHGAILQVYDKESLSLYRSKFYRPSYIYHANYIFVHTRYWAHTPTPKQLETHGYVFNTVATNALVLTHQDISIQSADELWIVLDQFYTINVTFIVSNVRK